MLTKGTHLTSNIITNTTRKIQQIVKQYKIKHLNREVLLMKTNKITAPLLYLALIAYIFNGCSNSGNSSGDLNTDDTSVDYVSREADLTIENCAKAPEAKDITGDFKIDASDGGKFENSNDTYTLTSAGTYTLSGRLDSGKIIINAGSDDKVTLILNNVSIQCNDASPISCVNADKLTITAADNSYNEINDNKSSDSSGSTGLLSLSSSKSDSDDSKTDNASIYSACDLTINGTGSLSVTGGYNNGIQSKKDLEIESVTLKSEAANHALKGNNSVTVTSGELTLVSENGHGIKTDDNDVSSKGKQHGTVLITSGNIAITSG